MDPAGYSDEADDMIERIIVTPEENVQRFKKKFSNFIHSRRFIDWRGTADFTRKLEMLLQDLKASVDDPLIGVELVARFMRSMI